MPFGEKGGRCTSGDMEKMSVIWDMNIHLVIFEQVDMSLEDTYDLEMFLMRRMLAVCCENFP